jgi:hypothetical protein
MFRRSHGPRWDEQPYVRPKVFEFLERFWPMYL